MLNVNNKMYLNKRFVVADVEFNTMFEIALAHILAHAYAIADTHIEDIEFDDVLFISDRSLDRCTLLESNDFKEAGVTMQRSNFPKRVKTVSAYEFNELTDDLAGYKEGVNLVIIGFINTIPEHIFNNIIQFFGRGVNFVIFGDPIIDAPEHNSYFTRYLTNASVSVRLEYDDYRISGVKKINNTLFKLRRDVTSLTEITASNHVSMNSRTTFSLENMRHYMFDHEDGELNTIVVPKRWYSIVSSSLYEYVRSRSSLDFQVGDEFYVKYTWIFEQDDHKYIIPPMTKITILQIFNQLFVQKHRCFVCDILVKTEDQDVIVRNAVIDFTDYMFNFDSSKHPENIEDFEDILNNINVFNQHIYDATVLKVVFAPVLTSDMCKYCYPTTATFAWIETIERDAYYSSDFNWYKIFCNTTRNIDIVVSDEFTDISFE